MLTIAQLQKLKPKEFEEAAEGWHKISSAAGEAKDRIDNEIGLKLRKHEEGAGVDAAMVRLRRLSGNFHYIQVECGLIRAALNGLASELRAAQKKLNDALAEAEAEKFTVKPDGSVHWVSEQAPVPLSAGRSATAGQAPLLVDADPKQAKAQEYADRIAAALQEASNADAEYSRTLSRLKADNDLTATNKDWLDVQKDMGAVRKAASGYLELDDIPKGKSPKENADWWRGLTPEERGDYVALFPASIGALDGIPADVRDEANRAVLAEKRAEYQSRLDAIPPEPPKFPDPKHLPHTVSPEWRKWNDEYRDEILRLNASLKGMDAIQRRLEAAGQDGLPEAYLLGFDPEGNGRAIIANGNPDTADHTAIYVPGTTSNLSAIEEDIKRMSDLWRASAPFLKNQSVSTITWLGYDAPQSIVKDSPFSHYANDAAPVFNRFIDGLNTSNESGSGGHTTVIGHSYGTTVVGSAARQGSLNADDVILAGSPGVQVGRAEDMDAPKGHVWNQAAPGDIVPSIGRFGHGYRTDWSAESGIDWIEPRDDRFGANQISTDTTGHSDYWKFRDDGPSQSLLNQAAIVTGRYDKVQYAE